MTERFVVSANLGEKPSMRFYSDKGTDAERTLAVLTVLVRNWSRLQEQTLKARDGTSRRRLLEERTDTAMLELSWVLLGMNKTVHTILNKAREE